MRVGRSVGEAYPLCMTNMEQLPAPNTYTKAGWLQYFTDIDEFVQAQNPKMQILDPLNQAGSGATTDISYGTDEAQTAVMYKNASGQTNGIGSQGLQAISGAQARRTVRKHKIRNFPGLKRPDQASFLFLRIGPSALKRIFAAS